MFRGLLAALIAWFLIGANAFGQEALQRRAREAASLIAEKPAWPQGLFHGSFTAKVSKAQLEAIGAQFFAKCGAVETVQQTSSKGPNFGTFDVITSKGFVVPMTIGIEANASDEVSTLLFGAPMPMLKTLADAAKALQALGGQVSFGVWRLSDGPPQPLVQLEPDRPLALGSAFKLYVLGALVQEVRDGKRTLADVVTLTPADKSLPSGQLQEWPESSPVTLGTAANLMISRSDNTATDLLMHALGRERVEAMLAPMGMADAARTSPFLTTAEMFRLKFVEGGKAGEAYAPLDEAARRTFLRSRLPAAPLTMETIDPGAFSAPTRIDSIEWFASVSDLARAVDWLRRNTEGPTPASAMLRGAMSINPGLSISSKQFPWIGFKGGSEPGVLNLTFLLKRADGTWFAVAATWNDPAAPLDEQAFMPIVQRAIWVLGNQTTTTANP